MAKITKEFYRDTLLGYVFQSLPLHYKIKFLYELIHRRSPDVPPAMQDFDHHLKRYFYGRGE